MASSFDVQEFSFHLTSPGDLDAHAWRDIQAVERDAFQAALKNQRTEEEIDYLISWGKPDLYVEARVNPQKAIDDGRFSPNQSFGKMLVALAYDGSNPVGYLYSADNTSGISEKARTQKMNDPTRRYAWLREAAVQPEHWGKGIIRALGYLSLRERDPRQRVTAYVWSENQRAMQLVREHDFVTPTGPDSERVFGPDRGPAEQWRFVAESAGKLMLKVTDSPGALEAIEQATRM